MAVPLTTNEEKRKTVTASAKNTEKRERIPQHILDDFFHVIQCEMEGTRNPEKETYDTHLKTAIRAQQTIGFDMMMRGFLAHEWMEALIRQGVPSLKQKMNQLKDIIWVEILGPLWFKRNDIKHGKR